MTTSTVRAAISPLDRPRVPWPVADALAVTKRNLISMTRTPQVIVFSTIQPVLLILIFRYVFAGSMRVPGVRYTDYLISGILVLTVAFGTQATATAVAEDLHRGLIERFRSLAMSRSALLAGRAIADTCRFLFMILLMIGAGYAVGFRLHTTALALAGAVALLLLFGFAMSWVMALLALTSKSAEAATAASFPVLALLCFPSNVFVATSYMPAAVRAYAANQPVSANADAVRSLLLAAQPDRTSWSPWPGASEWWPCSHRSRSSATGAQICVGDRFPLAGERTLDRRVSRQAWQALRPRARICRGGVDIGGRPPLYG